MKFRSFILLSSSILGFTASSIAAAAVDDFGRDIVKYEISLGNRDSWNGLESLKNDSGSLSVFQDSENSGGGTFKVSFYLGFILLLMLVSHSFIGTDLVKELGKDVLSYRSGEIEKDLRVSEKNKRVSGKESKEVIAEKKRAILWRDVFSSSSNWYFYGNDSCSDGDLAKSVNKKWKFNDKLNKVTEEDVRQIKEHGEEVSNNCLVHAYFNMIKSFNDLGIKTNINFDCFYYIYEFLGPERFQSGNSIYFGDFYDLNEFVRKEDGKSVVSLYYKDRFGNKYENESFFRKFSKDIEDENGNIITSNSDFNYGLLGINRFRESDMEEYYERVCRLIALKGEEAGYTYALREFNSYIKLLHFCNSKGLLGLSFNEFFKFYSKKNQTPESVVKDMHWLEFALRDAGVQECNHLTDEDVEYLKYKIKNGVERSHAISLYKSYLEYCNGIRYKTVLNAERFYKEILKGGFSANLSNEVILNIEKSSLKLNFLGEKDLAYLTEKGKEVDSDEEAGQLVNGYKKYLEFCDENSHKTRITAKIWFENVCEYGSEPFVNFSEILKNEEVFLNITNDEYFEKNLSSVQYEFGLFDRKGVTPNFKNAVNLVDTLERKGIIFNLSDNGILTQEEQDNIKIYIRFLRLLDRNLITCSLDYDSFMKKFGDFIQKEKGKNRENNLLSDLIVKYKLPLREVRI